MFAINTRALLSALLILPLPTLADEKCESYLSTVLCRTMGCIEDAMASSEGRSLPDKPGALTSDKQRFIFDKTTFQDADTGGGIVKGLIEPLLKEIPTPLGQERLRWEIERPLLNPALIRSRQKAIQALVQNPKERARLNALFKKHLADGQTVNSSGHPIPRGLFANTPEALRHLEDPSLWNGAGGDGFVLLQNFVGAAVPLGIVYELQAGVVFMAGAAHLGMYIGRGALEQPGFDEARHLVEMFKRNNHTIVTKLKQLQDPVLWQIADTLDRANNAEHPQSMRRAHNRMRRAMILNNSLFLPSYVSLTLATRGLNEHLETLIFYLDALAELELLTGIANFHAKNEGSHRLLHIRDTDVPAVRITEAHNPLILANQTAGAPSRPNEFEFSPQRRVELVTGANAMGKSTGLRTELQIAIGSQISLPVPARGELTPMIFIAGNKVTDTIGKSLMMAQCERIAQMLRAAIDLSNEGHPVMLKFDEPFDGTSPEERRALVAAIIIYVGSHPNLYASIATHERSLIDLVSGMEKINMQLPPDTETAPSHLLQKYSDALATVRNVHYHEHKKIEGGATTRNALQIAGKMGMPREVLVIAADILGVPVPD